MEINNKERRILGIANSGGVNREQCLRFYRTPHHINAIIRRLCSLGYLAPLESGATFVITAKGKEELGIEENRSLEDYGKTKSTKN
ncbi:MAG: hypothetical protein CL811_06595 [Colwelliaceae bacterium]|jgi:hypothetical protein|nr:hypothetical protein [Colwelliaceae bacterium]|tara:strand:- start:4886 stop:5143 length:258 start_codon:yes stop_codon:yes gene_type:complete